jgi:voltage-gated potassium channel
MLDSMPSLEEEWGHSLHVAELVLTILFTIEYLLRIYCLQHPKKYIFSFYGIIDFISILPTYLMYFFPGTQVLMMLRLIRVMRIFRILKLIQYVGEADLLIKALKASSRKVTVFLLGIIIFVSIFGSLMHFIEGGEHGFSSIPQSMYWAIVTLTTVGYGDVAPHTPMGKAFASLVMIMGYAVLAVPTGIVTVEFSKAFHQNIPTRCCESCGKEGHDDDAIYCKKCGEEIDKIVDSSS